jgi:hypothetical protein
MIDAPADEADVWFAVLAALRANGATLAEAIDGATILVAAYR